MIIRNKDVIQSYLLTSARYDFSVYEKRILYRLVESCQFALNGEKLNTGFVVDQNLFGDRIITMPISSFLAGEEDTHYSRVKEALNKLNEKKIEYEDERIWKPIRLIEKPQINKYSDSVTFEVQPEIYEAILSFSKGYRKFELKTAMEFKSVYAMRFYELVSNQKTPLTYAIDKLKIMFNIEDRYINRPADFIKYVVIAAKKELDEKSPYSFTYNVNKDKKKMVSVTFFPVKIAKNRDEDLETHELQKQVSISWDLDRLIVDYLKQNYYFLDAEIKNNIKTLSLADKKLDLLALLSEKKRDAETKRNPKGWIISVIKKILETEYGQQ